MTGLYVYLCKDCMKVEKKNLPVLPYPCPRCPNGIFRLMVQAVPQPGEPRC